MYKTVFDFILTLYVKIIKNNIFKINKLIKIKNIFTLYVTYKENNKKKKKYLLSSFPRKSSIKFI